VRLSGAGAVSRLSQRFSRPRALLNAAGNTIVHGWLVDAAARRIDETLVSVYRAPASYTGEESADISCHGGGATLRAVMGELFSSGFREALPGEFTLRAFLNGKLDLTRAESVMEIVGAKSEAGRANAIGRLSGVLLERLQAIQTRLVRALSETELNLDYSELDGVGVAGPDSRLPAEEAVEQTLQELDALAEQYACERLLSDGALIVIAGKPNAGKSSLFNLLIKEERSIVTEVPGTTRDWIESWIAFDGIPARLVDTAGLRPASDPVEQIGVRRSEELLGSADIALYLFDGTNLQSEDVRQSENLPRRADGAPAVIRIWNKADAAPHCPLPGCLPVSAKTGAGIGALCAELRAQLGALCSPTNSPSVGIGTPRQKELIDAARSALREALAMADRAAPLDLIAPSLREAIDALGAISGEVSTSDILDAMFSQFCVGK
jgi:tRNA modification GTPase